MIEAEEHYFKNDQEWRTWLDTNHNKSNGIALIFYKVQNEQDSMRWVEAVRVALCYGWIDSTVKSLGDGKRKQYFCPRKPKSFWSKVNKTHIKELMQARLMHESGLQCIRTAKQNGSWTALDAVENGVIPPDLGLAFKANSAAFENYQKFTKGQRKSYLYWLNSAKRDATRIKRIDEIIALCAANVKSRS